MCVEPIDFNTLWGEDEEHFQEERNFFDECQSIKNSFSRTDFEKAAMRDQLERMKASTPSVFKAI